MATLNIKAPNGKTLNINVPQGTPPEQYDAMVDEATQHYMHSLSPADAAGEGEDYPNSFHTTDGPSMDIAMAVDAAPGLVKSGISLAKAAPDMARAVPGVIRGLTEGAGDLASDLTGGIAKAASKVGDIAKGGWDALTNNTPRAFGYAQNAGATPEARQFAKDSIEFANQAHPEIADLVNGAAHRPIPATSGAPQIGGVEKGLATAEDVAGMPAGPGEAATDLPKPDTTLFNDPIRKGVLSGPEEMLEAAQAQRNTVGKAIENTLAKYDGSGSFYDPSKFNNQIKSMLERDMNGQVMTTGWQGEVNEAIKKAASSINDFSVGGPIKWSDAARIKSGLQGDTNYAVAGFNKANEAYKQVASLLKEDIDNQAMEMLQKNGGDIAHYQGLRDAYGKFDGLSDALNVAAKRNFANSPIPWWIKMGAGAALSTTGLGIAKGLLGH